MHAEARPSLTPHSLQALGVVTPPVAVMTTMMMVAALMNQRSRFSSPLGLPPRHLSGPPRHRLTALGLHQYRHPTTRPS